MTKVFFIGATGYIGGTVLQQTVAAHPSLEITAIVRDAEKASKVTSAFPNITTVIGDLDSTELIETQSALADIVINTADCDHVGSVNAIIRGIEKRGGGYFIHTSGIAILLDEPNGETLGEKVWDDITDLKEISNFPDTAIHRAVEKIILAAPPSVRTALISPGKVCGVGTGPVKKFTMPFIVESIITMGNGFVIGKGASAMSTVHIQDLARIYILVLNEALKPHGGAAQWGPEGYYFGVSDEVVPIVDHVRVITEELAKSGKIKGTEIVKKTVESVAGIHPYFPYCFGSNARARASRAKRLGWKPVEKPFLETIVVDYRLEYGA